MIANSSPLSRPTVSAGRTAARSRADTWRSSSSPAACPRVSLTCLNRSRSQKRTPRCAPSAGGGRAPASSRSRNSTRFGSPVSASWVAWCRTVAEQPGLLQRRRRLVADTAEPGEHVAVERGRAPRRLPQPAVATPRKVVSASSGTATTSAVPTPRSSSGAAPGCCVALVDDPRLAVGEHAHQLGHVLGPQHRRPQELGALVGQPDGRVRLQRPGRGVPQQDPGAGAADDAGQRLADHGGDRGGVGRGGRARGRARAGRSARSASWRASSSAMIRSSAAAAWPA